MVETVRDWPQLESGPHRFNAIEFLLEDYEIGHVHRDAGMLDINYPRRLRDALVEEGRTGDHHVVPDSGWTTYQVVADEDVENGIWLLRVAYLYRAWTRRHKPLGEAILREVDIAAELDGLAVSERVRTVFENVAELDSIAGPSGAREQSIP